MLYRKLYSIGLLSIGLLSFAITGQAATSEDVIKTTQSWDGQTLSAYSLAQPEVTIKKNHHCAGRKAAVAPAPSHKCRDVIERRANSNDQR